MKAKGFDYSERFMEPEYSQKEIWVIEQSDRLLYTLHSEVAKEFIKENASVVKKTISGERYKELENTTIEGVQVMLERIFDNH